MSLKLYAENSWIEPLKTSREEIQNLLGIVKRGVNDAKVDTISADLRVIAAFGAAMAAASAALRAAGYRSKTQSGHHQKTIECLEFTIGADEKLRNKLKAISKKRNATSYDAAGNVSEQELKLAIDVAEQLQKDVLAWLGANHKELL